MTGEQKAYLYAQAKAAKKGAEVQCPSCAKPFIKNSYQQAFCSNSGTGNCKDAYWQSVRAPGSDVRTPQDYAIEHAGYLATAADDMQAAFGAYGAALDALEEAADDADMDALSEALTHARDDLGEALAVLRDRTHEFRKRASRVTE